MSYNQLNKKTGEDIIELMDNDKYSYEKKMEKMCHLLKIGADVNIQDMYGWTPIVRTTNRMIAEKLLNNGAKLDLVDEYGCRIGDKCSGLLSSIAGRYNGYKFFEQGGAR